MSDERAEPGPLIPIRAEDLPTEPPDVDGELLLAALDGLVVEFMDLCDLPDDGRYLTHNVRDFAIKWHTRRHDIGMPSGLEGLRFGPDGVVDERTRPTP